MPRRPGRVVRAGVLFLLVGLLFAASLFAWSFLPGQIVGQEGRVVQFDVATSNKADVVRALEEQGLLHSPVLTRLYATWLTPGANFTPRSHLLSPGISARELVQRLAEVGSRPSVEVTLPEGWTHRKMGARLEEVHVCSELGFARASFDEGLLRELGLPGPSAEGYLFPARYRFALDSDPRAVVRRLVKESRRRLVALKSKHGFHPDLKRAGLDDHEVVVLSSIVEKETGLPSEAPRVARVFLNRLLAQGTETKGRLQSDPTAAYGCMVDGALAPSCSSYSGQVTPALLSDSQNPYNTYRHAGLPPGPISNPGERSIAAVLAPAEGEELYFVTDGKGGHTFSTSYDEHLEAVRRLREAKKAQKKR